MRRAGKTPDTEGVDRFLFGIWAGVLFAVVARFTSESTRDDDIGTQSDENAGHGRLRPSPDVSEPPCSDVALGCCDQRPACSHRVRRAVVGDEPQLHAQSLADMSGHALCLAAQRLGHYEGVAGGGLGFSPHPAQ